MRRFLFLPVLFDRIPHFVLLQNCPVKPLPLTLFLLVTLALAVCVYRCPSVAIPATLCLLAGFGLLALLRAARDEPNATGYADECNRQVDPASEVIGDKSEAFPR